MDDPLFPVVFFGSPLLMWIILFRLIFQEEYRRFVKHKKDNGKSHNWLLFFLSTQFQFYSTPVFDKARPLKYFIVGCAGLLLGGLVTMAIYPPSG